MRRAHPRARRTRRARPRPRRQSTSVTQPRRVTAATGTLSLHAGHTTITTAIQASLRPLARPCLRLTYVVGRRLFRRCRPSLATSTSSALLSMTADRQPRSEPSTRERQRLSLSGTSLPSSQARAATPSVFLFLLLLRYLPLSHPAAPSVSSATLSPTAFNRITASPTPSYLSLPTCPDWSCQLSTSVICSMNRHLLAVELCPSHTHRH